MHKVECRQLFSNFKGTLSQDEQKTIFFINDFWYDFNWSKSLLIRFFNSIDDSAVQVAFTDLTSHNRMVLKMKRAAVLSIHLVRVNLTYVDGTNSAGAALNSSKGGWEKRQLYPSSQQL
jgi:hypothetical protein